jgi:hypothetical protein
MFGDPYPELKYGENYFGPILSRPHFGSVFPKYDTDEDSEDITDIQYENFA